MVDLRVAVICRTLRLRRSVPEGNPTGQFNPDVARWIRLRGGAARPGGKRCGKRVARTSDLCV
ncbi:hypothetical protein ACFSHQ_12880 [Gemmobacter lanyuensis]